MDVILPAAGLGTRLRPHTWSKPKPLVPLAGKTILEHVLTSVLPAKPDKLIFITGYLGDDLQKWARSNLPVPTEFVVQPEMLGQTDAIIRCREVATGSALILFPDAVFDADFTGLESTDADVVVFTKIVEDPSQLGVVQIENDRVIRLVEKPQTFIGNQAVIGIYYFRSMPALYAAIEQQFARNIKTKGEYFIADAIQIMIDEGAIVRAQPIEFWEDCGNTEALLNTNKLLLERSPASVETRGNSIVIHPSVIGENVTLERSIVGPYTSIGSGSTIKDSIVSDSIVDADATVCFANLRHSVIGRKASVTGHGDAISIGDASQVEL
jgi:glucose-1-phosphate thymidylyltransferase